MNKDSFVIVKSSWLCSCCCKEEGKGKSQPLLSADKDEKEASDGSSQPSPDKTRIRDSDISMADLMRETVGFWAEIKQTNLDITTSIESYSEWIVENGKKIENVMVMVTELSIDISNMRQENWNLKKCVCGLTDKVHVLEQSLKDNGLEIHGVPSSDKGNVIELVGKVPLLVLFSTRKWLTKGFWQPLCKFELHINNLARTKQLLFKK